jgi:hypothetical protein
VGEGLTSTGLLITREASTIIPYPTMWEKDLPITTLLITRDARQRCFVNRACPRANRIAFKTPGA